MHIKQLEKVKQSVVTVIGHRLDCELENPFLLEIRNGQILLLLAFNIDTILRSTNVLKIFKTFRTDFQVKSIATGP